MDIPLRLRLKMWVFMRREAIALVASLVWLAFRALVYAAIAVACCKFVIG